MAPGPEAEAAGADAEAPEEAPAEKPPSRPRAAGKTLALLLVIAVAAGGYLIGRGSAEDLDAARDRGAVEGRKAGLEAGAGEGYAQGFAAAAKEDRAAYEDAYRAAYAKEFRRAGLFAPRSVRVEGAP